MPSLVPHPVTGKPVWDYDLPADEPVKKPTKKASAKKTEKES